MAQAARTSEVQPTPYAVASDFCRIFAEEMSSLYQLSFLLTADPAKAEQCFVSGLEDSAGANRVFREWARSWARRAIIQNAIRMIQPVPRSGAFPVIGDELASNGPLAALLGLKTFERFVFVMSVLEGYSDQDCKTLLRCSARDIVRARAQAVLQIAQSAKTTAPVKEAAQASGGVFAGAQLLTQTA